jgi:hypothetical protein
MVEEVGLVGVAVSVKVDVWPSGRVEVTTVVDTEEEESVGLPVSVNVDVCPSESVEVTTVVISVEDDEVGGVGVAVSVNVEVSPSDKVDVTTVVRTVDEEVGGGNVAVSVNVEVWPSDKVDVTTVVKAVDVGGRVGVFVSVKVEVWPSDSVEVITVVVIGFEVGLSVVAVAVLEGRNVNVCPPVVVVTGAVMPVGTTRVIEPQTMVPSAEVNVTPSENVDVKVVGGGVIRLVSEVITDEVGGEVIVVVCPSDRVEVITPPSLLVVSEDSETVESPD